MDLFVRVCDWPSITSHVRPIVSETFMQEIKSIDSSHEFNSNATPNGEIINSIDSDCRIFANKLPRNFQPSDFALNSLRRSIIQGSATHISIQDWRWDHNLMCEMWRKMAQYFPENTAGRRGSPIVGHRWIELEFTNIYRHPVMCQQITCHLETNCGSSSGYQKIAPFHAGAFSDKNSNSVEFKQICYSRDEYLKISSPKSQLFGEHKALDVLGSRSCNPRRNSELT
jgi:hypothetical protein